LILVDDDLRYSSFLVERLYHAQMRRRDSSFSFFVYRSGPFAVGQGADGFSFYTPNLAGIEEFAMAAIESPALFVTDDLWISAFLKNRGVRIRSLQPLLAPGESVYEATGDRPNQLRHLGGELQRHKAMAEGTRYLLKSGLLRYRLRLEYSLRRIPGIERCGSWAKRLIASSTRRIQALLSLRQSR
jgi:hypothetical protein